MIQDKSAQLVIDLLYERPYTVEQLKSKTNMRSDLLAEVLEVLVLLDMISLYPNGFTSHSVRLVEHAETHQQ